MSWSETKLLMDAHDEILEKLNNGIGIVKSIQRGVHNYTASDNPLSITINPVNVNKAVAFMEGTTPVITNNAPLNSATYFALESSTQLTIYCGVAMSGRSVRWTVVEFY